MKIFSIALTLILLGNSSALFCEEANPVSLRQLPSPKDVVLQFWASGQKAEALGQLDQWMAMDKNSPEPLVLAANLAFEQKKFKRCLKYAEKALEKSSESAGGYYWKGRALEAMSNWLEAANEYGAALLVDSNYPGAKESLERVKSHLGPSVLDAHSSAGASPSNKGPTP